MFPIATSACSIPFWISLKKPIDGEIDGVNYNSRSAPMCRTQFMSRIVNVGIIKTSGHVHVIKQKETAVCIGVGGHHQI